MILPGTETALTLCQGQLIKPCRNIFMHSNTQIFSCQLVPGLLHSMADLGQHSLYGAAIQA
jgi:hypothetical protein